MLFVCSAGPANCPQKYVSRPTHICAVISGDLNALSTFSSKSVQSEAIDGITNTNIRGDDTSVANSPVARRLEHSAGTSADPDRSVAVTGATHYRHAARHRDGSAVGSGAGRDDHGDQRSDWHH